MSESQYDYDLFVIGAGSGGVRAARMAAEKGARVAVAEEYRVGGTCVIRGCVPKKLFVYASHFAEEFEDAAGFGWTAPGATFSWKKLVSEKDKEIARLSAIYVANLEKAGVELIEGRATFKDSRHIEIERKGKREGVFSAGHILIATGAAPFLPSGVAGVAHAITSNEAFHLEELPKRIAIVGGGYIAVEFAGIFNGLGVETALLYRGEEILRGFDMSLRENLRKEMIKKGIDVRLQSDVAGIEKGNDGAYRVALKGGGSLETDLVMYATGRAPNTEGLGLEAAGVELGKGGAVIVDSLSRSSVPHIYAVGDVTNRVNLTPVAIREGAAFAETVFGGREVAVDHSCVPSAVFSQPQLGTVGLTEEAARREHDGVQLYETRFRAMKHALSGRDEMVLMKMILDGEGKILGVHIMGADAGEMIQLAGVAVRMGASKEDFDLTIAVHPTSAEELVTLK